jgi:hypothetical protein
MPAPWEGPVLESNSTTDGTGVRDAVDASKKAAGGRLAKTLDRTLEPRHAPGKPGRPEGAGNYQWTPDMDKLLIEFSTKYDPAKAKNVMAKRLTESCPRESKPREDSLRKAVERRMVFLGLSTGSPRKKAEPNPAEHAEKAPKGVRSGAWTPSEITALLGTLGGDLINETIVKRTHHSIEACYAKLRRLGQTVHELRSVAFTVDELAEMFQVSPRRVRTWKEKGWLKTTRRRVTDTGLTAFLKEHPGLIAFDGLPSYVRTFLLDLGYPAKEASSFHANVKSILESVSGRKRRSDAQTSGTSDSARSEGGPRKRVLDKIARWDQLREQRIGPQRSPRPSLLTFAAQAAG